MHFERLMAFQNAFKMHKLIFCSRKKIIKKICVPTLPKIVRPVTKTHLFFSFGLIRKIIKGGLCVSIDCYSAIFTFLKIKAFKQQSLFRFRKQVIRLNTKVIEIYNLVCSNTGT